MHTTQSKGFTLLESLTAIAICAVGVSASIFIITNSLQAGTHVKNKMVAMHLAQEGLEVVHHIRDNNWLSGGVWTDGIANTSGNLFMKGCLVSTSAAIDTTCAAGENLVFDSASNQYIHTSAVAPFSRTIETTYTPGTPAEIKVVSTVTCGSYCSVVLEELLYDWKS